MALTREIVTRRETEEKRTVEIKPYRRWGMFTSAGNKSLRNKAEGLLKKFEAIKASGDESRLDLNYKYGKAIQAYLKSYRRMIYSKNFGEASDTAVREVVWCFLMEIGGAVGLSEGFIDDIWEDSKSHPKN